MMLSRKETQQEHLLLSFGYHTSLRGNATGASAAVVCVYVDENRRDPTWTLLVLLFAVCRIGHVKGTYTTTPRAEEVEVENVRGEDICNIHYFLHFPGHSYYIHMNALVGFT
jgi:hypothetical protein